MNECVLLHCKLIFNLTFKMHLKPNRNEKIREWIKSKFPQNIMFEKYPFLYIGWCVLVNIMYNDAGTLTSSCIHQHVHGYLLILWCACYVVFDEDIHKCGTYKSMWIRWFWYHIIWYIEPYCKCNRITRDEGLRLIRVKTF